MPNGRPLAPSPLVGAVVATPAARVHVESRSRRPVSAASPWRTARESADPLPEHSGGKSHAERKAVGAWAGARCALRAWGRVSLLALRASVAYKILRHTPTRAAVQDGGDHDVWLKVRSGEVVRRLQRDGPSEH
jgi:hypothetical protein